MFILNLTFQLSSVPYVAKPCVIPPHGIVDVGEDLSYRQRTPRHVLQAVIKPGDAFVE